MSLSSSYVTGTDAFAEFVKAAYRIQSKRIVASEAAGGGGPNAEALVFLNEKGRIINPPNTPYTAVNFNPTQTNKRARLDRMWADCGGLLADEMLAMGLGGQISFPPELADIRPFLWKGFSAAIRYTFVIDLPLDEQQIDPSVKKNIAKAVAAGFGCRRAEKKDFPAILACIRETEQRQGFSYRLTEAALEQGLAIMQENQFRIYIVTAANGAVASCRIVLHAPGSPAVDWIAATSTEHLRSGATQAVINYALADLQAVGATLFDFSGAGIASVSAAKATWGGRLIPCMAINQESLKTLAVRMYTHLRGRPKRAAKAAGKKEAAPSQL